MTELNVAIGIVERKAAKFVHDLSLDMTLSDVERSAAGAYFKQFSQDAQAAVLQGKVQ